MKKENKLNQLALIGRRSSTQDIMSDPTKTEWSPYHIGRMSHSLGVNFYNAILSNKKSERTCPTDFYRNHYQADGDPYLDNLVAWGYMHKTRRFDIWYYIVTDAGKNAFIEKFNELIKYVPVKNRNEAYLIDKINLYCWWSGYTFRADHVISEFEEKYSEGGYMSHTTRDAVYRFAKELKRNRKLKSIL